ncbi:hypothetical protein [Streptomyces sp. YKOK-J1]
MSTEARRTPVPPRPATPPRPADPPRGHAPETAPADTGTTSPRPRTAGPAAAPRSGDARSAAQGTDTAAAGARPGDRGGESWTAHGALGRGGTAPGGAGAPSEGRGQEARADATVPAPAQGGRAGGPDAPQGTASRPVGRRPGAPTAAVPASAPDDADDDEPSVFAPRAARNPAGRVPGETRQGGERSGTARPAAGPRFPAFPSATGTGGADPSDPPPPPASARFPDAPPNAARAGAPSRRPGAPAESASETTTRLRPVPSAPEQRRSGSGGEAAARPAAPAESGAETTTRLRPVPSAPEQRRSGSAPGRGGPVPASGSDRPAAARQPAASRPVSAQPPARPLSQPPSGPARPASAQRPAPPPGVPAPPPGVPAPSSPAPSGTGVRDGRPAWSPGDPAHPAGPAPLSPDPVLSWSAGGAARPVVSFGEPEYGERPRTRAPAWLRPRTAAAAACLVLGLGLVGGAVTGSWLTGDGSDGKAGTGFSAAGTLWHSMPVDRLFPPVVQGTGAGPGGADRTWTRIAVAPDSSCADAFDPLLRKVLAPVGCRRLLRATYSDATQSHVTTVGLLFTKGDPAAMSALAARFRDEHLDRRADLMPRPYAAKGTAAARFGDRQRATWTVSVLTDAPVVAYAVSGWADGRPVDSPQPAADAVRSGAGSAPAQAGLGQEAQGLADRVERRLRQTAGPATESPS